jgi:hypothetical protein
VMKMAWPTQTSPQSLMAQSRQTTVQ